MKTFKTQQNKIRLRAIAPAVKADLLKLALLTVETRKMPLKSAYYKIFDKMDEAVQTAFFNASYDKVFNISGRGLKKRFEL